MAHLIDKDTLVGEIESYISNYKDILARTDRNDTVWVDFVSNIEAKIDVLQHLLIFLDILEEREKLMSTKVVQLMKMNNSMVQYIDKSAVVAKMEKRYEYWREKEHNSHSIESGIRMSECRHLMLLLDTLEVKEIDLEKELKGDWLFANKTEVDCLESVCLTEDMFVSLAKKYFQLGLKASNPITATDRGTAEEIIINLKRVEKDYRIDLAREIEWLRKGE